MTRATGIWYVALPLLGARSLSGTVRYGTGDPGAFALFFFKKKSVFFCLDEQWASLRRPA